MAETVTTRNMPTIMAHYQPQVGKANGSEEGQKQQEVSFEAVLSSSPMPTGFGVVDKLLNTDSTLQVKQKDTRVEIGTRKTNDNRDVNEPKTDTTQRVTRKEHSVAPKLHTQTDSDPLLEVEDLDPIQIIEISTADTEQKDEEFSFSPIDPKSVRSREDRVSEEDTKPLQILIVQQGAISDTKTIEKFKMVPEDRSTGETKRARLLDSVSFANGSATTEEASITDPKITQVLNRVLLPQPIAIAHVQVLNQPVTPMILLASAVPLQVTEAATADTTQPYLNVAVTAVEGEKASTGGNGGSEFSQDHAGAFANQRSADTASPSLDRTKESLNQTSTQQAEKVQALQQVMQDFRTQLSKITGRPTNLRINVTNSKLGNVRVDLNFNDKEKTVSAVFHAESDEMVQMLTQKRSELEEIFIQAKLKPTAESLKFYKIDSAAKEI